MAEKILTGYLLRDVVSLADAEMILFEMKSAVAKRANVAYKSLIEWQTERVVDEITLNRIQRPENSSILDVAAGEVRRRIFFAEKSMQDTEFNLYAGVQVMTGKIDGKPVVYFKTIVPNDFYSKSFRKIKELEPFDVSSDDLKNKKGTKTKFYEDLCGKYSEDIPLLCSLINYDALSFKLEDLKFRTPSERAEELAREQCMNRLLAWYACEQEIAPYKLMEYVSFAYERTKKASFADMVAAEKAQLERLLPEIDLDTIVKIGMPEPSSTPIPAEESVEDEGCSCPEPDEAPCGSAEGADISEEIPAEKTE